MNQIDWGWLGLTLTQVLGFGIIVTAFGFAYDRAARERVALMKILVRDHIAGWFVLGMSIFSLGLLLGEAQWLQKAASVGITIILGWMAWQSRRQP